MNQDFEVLVNAPISCGYFTFKSEKNWNKIDTSKYSELFSIDVKNLSMIYNCIPFNQYVEVEDEYFTKDQLTFLNSAAEDSKKLYEKELEKKKTTPLLKNIEKSTSEDTIDEDLDFLLSLKEPIINNLSGNISVTSTKFETNELKVTNESHTNKSKPIDLEKWLDSVLDE